MGMIADLFVKLGLKNDEFNRGIDQAKQKTTMLGGAMSKLGGIMAGAFAVSAIWSFVKNAVKSYNDTAQANAKMNAVLKSTAGQAGVTAAAIKGLSSELSASTLYSGSVITNGAALMLTFTKIGKTVFPEAMRAAANMSSVLGTDLQSTIIQVGKALNSPTVGLTALRRSGVSFTDEQVSMIKTLTATGRLMEAQQMIIAELKTEFDGAAVAAANAGTSGFVMLSKQIKSVSKALGEAIVESKYFKTAMELLLYSLVNTKKFFDFNDKAKTLDVELGVDSIVSNLPVGVEEAKKIINKNIEELRGYAADYAATITRESSGVWNKIQLANPMSGQSRKIDQLKKQADLYQKQIEALEKYRDKIKPVVKKEDLTFAQQYAAAIQDLKNDILEAEEAAKTSQPGKQFVEASKAVADAKKALQDFIDTYAKEDISPRVDITKLEAWRAEEERLITAISQGNDALNSTPKGEAWDAQKSSVEKLTESLKSLHSEMRKAGAVVKIEGKYVGPEDIGKLSEQDFWDKINKKTKDKPVPIYKPGLNTDGTLPTIAPPPTIEGLQTGQTKEALIAAQKEADLEKIKAANQLIIDEENQFNETIKSGLSNITESFIGGIAELAIGAITPADFGKQILGVVGNFMVQLGMAMITTATLYKKFQASLATGGFGSIGIGIALVAAGAALSSLAKAGPGGSGAGGSSAASGYSYSSGASSAGSALSGNVVFELQGNKLKGVLNNQDRRNLNFG